MAKNQHVVPHSEGWGVKGEGNSKVTRVFETQRDAIACGRQQAINQSSELFIRPPA